MFQIPTFQRDGDFEEIFQKLHQQQKSYGFRFNLLNLKNHEKNCKCHHQEFNQKPSA